MSLISYLHISSSEKHTIKSEDFPIFKVTKLLSVDAQLFLAISPLQGMQVPNPDEINTGVDDLVLTVGLNVPFAQIRRTLLYDGL